MSAITSWTDLSMDWTDPVPSEAKYIEAIRLATIERCKATSTSHTSIDFPLYENSQFGILLSQSFISTLHALIRSLITKYVNHTDNSGDWDGEDTIPDWTKNTILKSIGDNEAPLPQVGMLPSQDWVLQQYNILNLLLWIQEVLGFTDKEEKEGQTLSPPRYSTAALAWSAYSTDYDTLSFSSGWGADQWIYTYATMNNNGASPGFQAFLNVQKGKLTGTYPTLTGNASMDIYGYAALFGNSDQNTYQSVSGWTENKYNFFETIAEKDASTAYTSALIDPAKPEQPAGSPGSGETYARSAGLRSSNIGVLKFDGANGFNFKP